MGHHHPPITFNHEGVLQGKVLVGKKYLDDPPIHPGWQVDQVDSKIEEMIREKNINNPQLLELRVAKYLKEKYQERHRPESLRKTMMTMMFLCKMLI